MKKKPYAGWIYLEEKKDPALLAIIAAEFDRETDEEEVLRKKNMIRDEKQSKYAYRISILKTLMFPLELLLGTAIAGMDYANNRILDQKAMFRHLMRKTNYKQFMAELER